VTHAGDHQKLAATLGHESKAVGSGPDPSPRPPLARTTRWLLLHLNAWMHTSDLEVVVPFVHTKKNWKVVVLDGQLLQIWPTFVL
jgi:hypothetical protein